MTSIPLKTNNHLIIINGKPRSGKDTVSEYLYMLLRERGYYVYRETSIQPIINGLQAGFSIYRPDGKPDAWRDCLAEVGNALEKYCDLKSEFVLNKVANFDGLEGNRVMMVMVRENEVIDKIIRKVRDKYGWHCVALFVSSERAKNVDSNSSDRDAGAHKKGMVIRNDGTKGQLFVLLDRQLDDILQHNMGPID